MVVNQNEIENKREENIGLLREALLGSVVAKEKLMAEYSKSIFDLAKLYAKDEQELEELIQIGKMEFLKALDEFEMQRNISFRLFVENRISNLLAEHQISKNGDSADMLLYYQTIQALKEETKLLEKKQEELMFLASIQDSVLGLNHRDRKIIMLYLGIGRMHRLSRSEIAQELGLSLNHVVQILENTINKIRLDLYEKYEASLRFIEEDMELKK